MDSTEQPASGKQPATSPVLMYLLAPPIAARLLWLSASVWRQLEDYRLQPHLPPPPRLGRPALAPHPTPGLM